MDNGRRETAWLRYGVAGAVVVGAAVRLIYLLQIKGSPFFNYPISDGLYYDRWATAIAQGDVLGQGPFFRGPLYPYFLGMLYALTGRSLVWVRVIQHVVGLVGVILTAMLGRRVAGDRVGVLAAWLMALYPTAIYYEGEILSDSLLTVIAPALILATLLTVRTFKTSRALIAGLVCGLFAVARPTILATLPVLMGWVAWQAWRSGQRRAALKLPLVYVAGTLAIITPVTARNVLVGHDFVTVAWQGGFNFAIGNNPQADGVSAALPPWGTGWMAADAVSAAEQARGRRLRPSEVSSYWTEQGLRFWQESPDAALALLCRKLVLFWQNAEYSNIQSRSWFTSRWGSILHWIPLSFGMLIASGVIGWWKLRRDASALWILAWTLSHGLVIALFFIVDRYRLPIIPVWIVAAATGVVWLWEHIRSRRWLATAAGIAVAAGVYGLSLADPWHLSGQSQARSYLALGNVELRAGNAGAAIAACDSALALDTAYPGVWLSRGAAHYRLGNLDSAAACFAREATLRPDDARALANLAQAKADQGDTMGALVLLDQALARHHNSQQAALMKARLLRATGRPDEAYETLMSVGKTTNTHDAGQLLLAGAALLDMRRYEEADSTFAEIIRERGQALDAAADPDAPVLLSTTSRETALALAHYNRGVIAGYHGRWRQAIEELHRATSGRTGGLGQEDAWANLSTAYLQVGVLDSALICAEHAVETAPQDPLCLYARALAHLHLGDTLAARGDLQAAVDANAHFAPARSLLQTIAPSPAGNTR